MLLLMIALVWMLAASLLMALCRVAARADRRPTTSAHPPRRAHRGSRRHDPPPGTRSIKLAQSAAPSRNHVAKPNRMWAVAAHPSRRAGGAVKGGS
jgi:hypothetical protein